VKKPTAFGKYFLLERINVGGMAEVFRSKAYGVEGFERLVAVKRILPNIAEDQEFIRMFIEEAKLSVQLNHANIAQIFDLGVVDGAYYIALEHVHGRDLRGIFDRGRQLGEAMPVAQACFVAMKVCEGLDYAHNKRDQAGRELSLVHRDVSPQNILVSFEGEVKLIDFGIAKAAGTGAQTQAGILKGKFGYMSPEQVRGLAVDRRSDVFSCGIVLHELLTGERLFFGESDFSTLEKVRNVEILPPSTYNRKIPDELERIVLKALTKDVDDRYQNAIDLHDELQAFVYTAGEFYSRKDLAGWMKKMFGKEIDEETARLESYRRLRPPELKPSAPGEPALTLPMPRPATPSKPPPQRSAMPPVAVGKPPPPPVSRAQPVQVLASVPVPGKPNDLGWDDDDLETQIYDGDGDNPKRKSSTRSSLPLQPPVSSSPGISLPAGEHADVAPPDLSSLAPNGAICGADAPASDGWPQVASSGRVVNGMGAGPAAFPSGSNRAPSPLQPELRDPSFDPPARGDAGPVSGGDGPTSTTRLASAASPAAELPLDPMAALGARSTGIRRGTGQGRSIARLVVGGAAVVAVTVVVVILLIGGRTPVVPGDPNTGFDLYVTPPGVTQWKLDGDARTDRLPSRIRGIAAGPHTVQIDPPPGFLSQLQQVAVELGKAPKVEITLQPIAGIVGLFDSQPPGATVSLIVDGKRQEIGPSPATAPLDPRNTYRVLFEKPGYVSVNRPVTLSGGLEERIIVNLEKAVAENPAAATPGPPASRVEPRPQPPPRRPAPAKAAVAPPAAKPAAKAQGVLVLGSKPPCEIAIDGSATGLHTPQKEIKLSVGRHRITLTNSEFRIKETFSVDIKAGTPEKAIKDYSDRLPK
jgi:serine/threonine protein kinase